MVFQLLKKEMTLESQLLLGKARIEPCRLLRRAQKRGPSSSGQWVAGSFAGAEEMGT